MLLETDGLPQVLISRLADEMGFGHRMEGFKALLVSLYEDHQLVLSKADMPQTLPRGELERSAIPYGGRVLTLLTLE